MGARRDTYSANSGSSNSIGGIAFHTGKPRPVEYVNDKSKRKNGEVVVTREADPEKLKAYYESPEYKRRSKSEFGRLNITRSSKEPLHGKSES